MGFLEPRPVGSPSYAAAMIDTSKVSAVSAMLIAQVEREFAEFEAADRAAADAAARLTTSKRDAGRAGASVVFTVRLDPQELDALRQRAAARGLRPSVLARNLIRLGLQPPGPSDEVDRAAEHLEAALAAFRALVPAH